MTAPSKICAVGKESVLNDAKIFGEKLREVGGFDKLAYASMFRKK